MTMFSLGIFRISRDIIRQPAPCLTHPLMHVGTRLCARVMRLIWMKTEESDNISPQKKRRKRMYVQYRDRLCQGQVDSMHRH